MGTRTRLSNEEKAAGMTLQQKKDGVTVSQLLKKQAKAESEIIEGADLVLDEATTIELNEEFVPLEEDDENENVLAVMHEPSEKTQENLNESFKANAPTGLGDVVDAVTSATGIKALVKFFTPEGKDCGCEERRKKLNELHLRGKQPFCLELYEYTFLKGFFDSNPFEANASQAMRMRTIYARIFRMDVSQVGSCSGCMRDLINELKAIVGTYE